MVLVFLFVWEMDYWHDIAVIFNFKFVQERIFKMLS